MQRQVTLQTNEQSYKHLRSQPGCSRTHPAPAAARLLRPCGALLQSSARRRRQRFGKGATQLRRRHHAAAVTQQSRCASAAAAAPADAEADGRYMRQALDLARRGVGHTAPNPAVGCVIVRHGEVVGQGYHPKAGQPHAEVFALRAAGQAARGATAYVTLEPCNHYGRTPPCALALVDAGVSRVVVGVTDPNPLVGGAGITTLRNAGIQVESGVEEVACYAINEEFMHRMAAEAAGSAGS